ncbi:MAG: hypothetical protein DRN81_05615 [Thermoproteota archaeon]|nr:MAG: hypothetical protein DRN81_05615 [Candidatus Korarchaeota archaeon]
MRVVATVVLWFTMLALYLIQVYRNLKAAEFWKQRFHVELPYQVMPLQSLMGLVMIGVSAVQVLALRGSLYRDICAFFGFKASAEGALLSYLNFICVLDVVFLLLWITGEVSLSLRLLKMVGIYILLLIICANNLCYC